MADVSVTILDNASPMVRRMAASMHDFREPLATMALILDRSFKRQFKVSGKPPWKPLSAKTIFFRRRWSKKPLIDTGRLMKSYTARSTDGIYNLQSKQLIIGSNLDYAELHQFGGTTTMQEKRWFKTGKKAHTAYWTKDKGNGKPRRWIRASPGTADVQVKSPKLTRPTAAKWVTRTKNGHTTQVYRKANPGGIPAGGYKLKHVNSYVTIRVPARPLKIQSEDVASMKTALERWIIRKAHNRP
jgi:phage gpG-like protein